MSSIQFLPEAMAGDIAGLARDFVAAGATHLIFSCPMPYGAAGARWVWEDIVVPLRGEEGAPLPSGGRGEGLRHPGPRHHPHSGPLPGRERERVSRASTGHRRR